MSALFPPRYADLPAAVDGERSAWQVFGEDDELGTLNWIDREATLSGIGCVSEGVVVNLDLPLGFGTSLSRSRTPLAHEVIVSRSGMDDYLDSFYPQSSSQWDGFRHVRYGAVGYFGGRQDEDLVGEPLLGVDAWARHGIATRGVLLDVPRYCQTTSREWDPAERSLVTTELLEGAADWSGVRVRRGDVLMVRTGWLRWYSNLTAAQRQELPATTEGLVCAGLDPSRDVAAWLWDNGVSGVAADNPALEALPVQPEQGFLHRRLLSLLGMPIGEMWDLEEAGRRCADLGTSVGLLVSSPINLPGGAGTPANAYFIL